MHRTTALWRSWACGTCPSCRSCSWRATGLRRLVRRALGPLVPLWFSPAALRARVLPGDELCSLQRLRTLGLAHNALASLDGLPPGLHFLDVSGNNLARLDGVAVCRALRELVASHNRIASVVALRRCAKVGACLVRDCARAAHISSLGPSWSSWTSPRTPSPTSPASKGLHCFE